jgi:septal ring factor EnvC (AmiA/AmiB activator)
MNTVKFNNSILPIVALVCIAIVILIAATLLTSCSSPAEKLEAAQENVKDANKDLDKANEAYLVEIEAYRKESAAKISANDKSIADFNARIENEKKEVRDEYKKKIAELEQKNSDVKRRLDGYKADGKDNWVNFKQEFSRDMDALGKALKDLTVSNLK